MADALRQLHVAREEMLSTGRLSQKLSRSVRPEILQSWRRSLMSGARAETACLPPYQPDGIPNEALQHAAGPVLAKLAERLSGLDAAVLLSDHHARILQRWVPDRSARQLHDSIGSDAGFALNEELVGTNGVGSVAETGTPIQISGPEHFAQGLVGFTCVGAPVHNPITRRLQGVITLSCRAESANALLTPLMVSAATTIEERLAEHSTVKDRALLDAFLRANPSGKRSIAAVGAEYFIADAWMTRILERMNHEGLWGHVSSVVRGNRTGNSELTLADGARLAVACSPIELGEDIIGAVLEIDRTAMAPRSEPTTRRHTPPASLGLPGRSQAWKQVLGQAAVGAASDEPLVITGEAGVGKRTIATAMFQGRDPAVNLRTIDCALEIAGGTSSLLGSLATALAEQPDVLLLHHLEALTSDAAAAISALVDSHTESAHETRFVASMLVPDDVSAGLQRLLDRLAVQRIDIPPLRERRQDIPDLVEALLQRHAGGRSLRVTREAMRVLSAAPWQGNVRELERVVRGLVAMSDGATELDVDSLPDDIRTSGTGRHLTPIEQSELNAIVAALKQADGNKVKAAELCGISRSTLYRKMRAYRLDPTGSFF